MTHSDLLDRGSSAFDVQQQLRRGELVRLCRGVYTRREDIPSGEKERHRLWVLGHALRSDYAVSHVSAAVLHGLPMGGADLREVHVTRIGHGGQRHVSGRRVHSSPLDPRWCTVVDGVLVTTVARTLADLSKVEPLEVAVSAADAALFLKKCTREDLNTALVELKFHAGGPRARRAMALVDGRSESPGETRASYSTPGPFPRPSSRSLSSTSTADSSGGQTADIPSKECSGSTTGRPRYGAPQARTDHTRRAARREEARVRHHGTRLDDGKDRHA